MSEGAEVIWLEGAEAATKGVPVANVCDSAKEACEEVVVVGYEKGSGKLYVASSFAEANAERSVWIMEQAKAWLIAGCPPDD
jgi:hypothetical protein